MSLNRIVLFLVAGMIAGAPFANGAPAAQYKITKSIDLGSPERWDYLTFDPISHRVYVAHGDRVTVVDGRTGAVIGNVEGMPGSTHGTAISHTTGHGFTDDGKAGEAVVFDLKTLKVVKRIKAELDADGVVFDPISDHIFVIGGDSAKL